MPLYQLKSNRRGEDGREYLVLLRCTALQKFYFANVSTVFASRFLVIHHLSIFLIDILYKKSPKPRSKIMVNCNIYDAIQCTNRRWILVSLPIFCTRPSQWDFIVTGYVSCWYGSLPELKFPSIVSVLLPGNKRRRSDQMLLVSYVTSKLFKRNLNRIVHIKHSKRQKRKLL